MLGNLLVLEDDLVIVGIVIAQPYGLLTCFADNRLQVSSLLRSKPDELTLADILAAHLVPIALALWNRNHLRAVIDYSVRAARRFKEKSNGVRQRRKNMLLTWLN